MAQEETSAAAGAPGDAGRGPGPEGAAWDPEQWWSFGEAADRAGITHRTLQDWAEQGSVMVRMAWREGMEIRLVRAGDVARLAPEAARSAGDAASLEERALFTGPRRSGLGAGAPVPPTSPEGEAPARYEDDRDALRRTSELEIERLRAEVEVLRRRGAARQRGEAAAPAAMDLWSIEEPGRLGARRGRQPGRSRWPAVFSAGVALGLLLGILLDRPTIRLLDERPTVAVDSDGAAVQVAAVGGVEARAPGANAGAAPDNGPADAQLDLPADRPAHSQGEPLGAGLEPAAESSTALEPTPDRLGRALPLSLGEIAGAPRASLDGRTTCAFAEGELATPRSLRVLGGCFGERLPDSAGVLATDRVQGVACCKHHAAVQRLKGVASAPRALEVARREAEQAIRDGFLPPMVELRAERSAVLLVRALSRGWRASGFDGPVDGRVHRWSRAELPGADARDPEACVELVSWLERAEDGSLARYRLLLELGVVAAEDQALEFQWLD